MAQADIKSTSIGVAGVVGAAIVFVLIVAAQTLYYHMMKAEEETKLGKGPEPRLRELEAQQYGQLHSYRWVDSGKKIAAIPIDRAMELLAAEKRWGSLPAPPAKEGAK